MSAVRALVRTSHPLPSLALTAMAIALVIRVAPHGVGPLMAAPTVLLGELSIGWSNDYFDAEADAASGRTDKPIVNGEISRRAVLVAAGVAVAASVVLGFTINRAAGSVNVAQMCAGWFYNAGLKETPLSGLAYAIGFGLVPEFVASTAPGVPGASGTVLLAAVLLGVGGHFANALPDLERDRKAGIRGLPNWVAERFGAAAARGTALVLLVGASALIAAAGSTWLWLGFAAAGGLALAGLRGAGRTPFLAALGIAGIDVALFVLGGVPLS